jgi:hypothetical protein
MSDSKANSIETGTSASAQTPADRAANAAAAYDPGADPARLEDGDHSLYPNITISGARIYAYAEDGVLTVSVDLDDALTGKPPAWAAYGPADRLVPVRITVQGHEVFRATPEDRPATGATGAEDRMSRAISEGTDFVTEHLDLGEGDSDLANVVANAIGTAWRRQGQPFTWPEFIAENWSAEPGSTEDPATWWGWGRQARCADHGDPPHRHDSDGEPCA